ncbi:hypothetical protein B0H63DRAFT_271845 [Podospora didyma]|uniref:Secreted protein n=1 Tax=Podospora didyma TaxID=330526 RepID=A0AAE0KFG4_9PEZI|nr:hypothetical protein B0H63DRAFT_271845 [Podospora didyma]
MQFIATFPHRVVMIFFLILGHDHRTTVTCCASKPCAYRLISLVRPQCLLPFGDPLRWYGALPRGLFLFSTPSRSSTAHHKLEKKSGANAIKIRRSPDSTTFRDGLGMPFFGAFFRVKGSISFPGMVIACQAKLGYQSVSVGRASEAALCL